MAGQKANEAVDELSRQLAKRGIGASVRERILRLNPDYHPGKILRGWHPHKRAYNPWAATLSKGQFIRLYGREAFNALPRMCVQHDGHRKFILPEHALDELWRLPANDPIRRARRVRGGWLIPTT